MVFATAVSLYAFTVTNNPQGGLYPAHLRRTAKVQTIDFMVSTIGDSVAIHTALDTTSGNWNYYFRVPFACKIDSFYMINRAAILAADTASGRYWEWRVIGNQSATNGDTIVADSCTAGWGGTITALTLRKLRLGPDSTQKFDAGKLIKFETSQTGAAATPTQWYIQMFLTPADR